MDAIKYVNLTINGKKISVPTDYTILKACDFAGIFVPRLCYVPGIHEDSSCRVCVVEIEGQKSLKNSCKLLVSEGMVVKTNTPRVIDSVKENLKLTAANHVFECWRCMREHNCEFLSLLRKYDVVNEIGENECFGKKERIINGDNEAIVLDSGKCTLCGRCVSACEKFSGLNVLGLNNRGSKTVVGPALLHEIGDSGCIMCGKCLQACPTAAIAEKNNIADVVNALNDETKFVVVQAAPAVRAALGEEFGLSMGTDVEGKMYAAMKALGFDEIADVNWGADLTILEEGTEFLHRFQNNGVLPMMTSCSPGWIRYIEMYEADYLPNLSSCKSPHQMSGAMIKHYWCKEKLNKDVKDVVVVSVMPCIAKKYESNRPEMQVDGVKDVDYVITTREFARLIKRQGIDFVNLESHRPTSPLAQYTGAASIFGVTSGVMEAALRTVCGKLSGKKLDNIDLTSVRGFDGIKEASVNINGTDVNVAVVCGGVAIREFFKILKSGEKQYHFVEIMGCIGGCVNGGGQPITASNIQLNELLKKRASVLYKEDQNSSVRQSHLNDSISRIYAEFLGEPNSHTSHKYLHTHYSKKEFYK